MPKLQNTPSPAGRPCTTSMGYCNTVTGANAQTRAWSSQARPEDIPIPLENSQRNRRNASLSEILNGPDTPLDAGQTFHNQPGSVGAFTPPSVTSKSTLQSTLSTKGRDSQSQRNTSREPLEQSCDRLFLPVPGIFMRPEQAKLEFHQAYPCLTEICAVDNSANFVMSRAARSPATSTSIPQ